MNNLEKYWVEIRNSILSDSPKEELLKTVRSCIDSIEEEMGLIDEKRKNAEDYFNKVLKDYNDLVNSTEETSTDINQDLFYIHCSYPLVFTKDNFLSKEECEHIIKIAEPNFTVATVHNEHTQEEEISKYRKSKVCYFSHNHDEIIRGVIDKISAIVTVSPHRAEKLQVVMYEEGDFFDYHTDAFDLHDINMKKDGQRIFTTMVYLNEVLEGGETHFKLIDVKIQPKQGRLLVFGNCLKNSNHQNPQTLHAGLPVIKGKKYAINLWYRENVINEYALVESQELIN